MTSPPIGAPLEMNVLSSTTAMTTPKPVEMLAVDHSAQTVSMSPEPLAHEMLASTRTMTRT